MNKKVMSIMGIAVLIAALIYLLYFMGVIQIPGEWYGVKCGYSSGSYYPKYTEECSCSGELKNIWDLNGPGMARCTGCSGETFCNGVCSGCKCYVEEYDLASCMGKSECVPRLNKTEIDCDKLEKKPTF